MVLKVCSGDLAGFSCASHSFPGRGRGDSCFYQRSIEEGDGAFGRNPREIQRSQSWDDRCRLKGGGIEAEHREAPGLRSRVP